LQEVFTSIGRYAVLHVSADDGNRILLDPAKLERPSATPDEEVWQDLGSVFDVHGPQSLLAATYDRGHERTPGLAGL
jgi:hypothetical protein